MPQVVTTVEAKNSLMDWIERSPLKIQQGQVVAAIIAWFLKQKPFVQTAVLSRVDEGMEHAYATALRKLADEIEGEPRVTVKTTAKAAEARAVERALHAQKQVG